MQNSSLRVRIANKIEELPRQDWESVFPAVLENYSFSKTLDDSSFDQFSFYYILVYDHDLPVGAASCFLMDFPLDIAVKGPLKAAFGILKKAVPGVLIPRVLFCGLPMGHGRIGLKGEPVRLMQAISDALERLAEEKKASMIIFKDFGAQYDNILRPLTSRGFSRVESFPSTEMDISFSSFGEYLKTLSPASRENLKRNFKKVDGKVKIDLEVASTPDGEVLSEIYGLYLQTHAKQDMGMEKLPLDFFRNASRNMPEEVKYFLWRVEGKLVAFAFCLVSGGHFIDYYLGFDYAVAKEYYLYFVRFRDLLDWCIKNGVKKYEMGVTTYEPKRRLGFDFIRLYFYMKHRNKLLNLFFAPVSLILRPANFDSVFKEMQKDSLVVK